MESKETYRSGFFAPSPSPSSATRDDDNESTGLSSARASPPTGLTMDSYMQSFHLQQLAKTGDSLMNPSAPPPPIALSLRTREVSAMALKHIFDQQINNNASSREQGQQMGGFPATRNQSMPDLRKRSRVPDLDLSFKKTQDSNFLHVEKGFGSPISTPSDQSSLLQAPVAPPMSAQLRHHNNLPQAIPSARLNPSSRQPTAQMTVFYAGNVNVYDDVPADKAHAIMLLAGNSWSSSSFKCPAPPPATVAPAASLPGETMMMKERAPSPMKATLSQHACVPSIVDRGGSMAKSYGSPGPVIISLASPPPSPALQAPSPAAEGAKSSQPGVVKRPHAGIELPHARKVSLARFLEKRKDRVQVQQDQQGGGAFEKREGELTSGNDKPDHPATSSSSKKHSRSRSPSPSPSRSMNKKQSANIARDENSSINEHRFFR